MHLKSHKGIETSYLRDTYVGERSVVRNEHENLLSSAGEQGESPLQIFRAEMLPGIQLAQAVVIIYEYIQKRQ